MICRIPSNVVNWIHGHLCARKTFWASIRCVLFGTGPYMAILSALKIVLCPHWTRPSIWGMRSEITRRCQPPRPTFKGISNWNPLWNSDVGMLQSACHGNLPLTIGCPILSNHQIEGHCELPSIWQEIESYQGELRTFYSMLQGCRSDRLPFGDWIFSSPQHGVHSVDALISINDNMSYFDPSALFNRVNPDRVTICDPIRQADAY